jgi:TrmH RNA methyltransferase
MRPGELKICGLAAVKARFERDPASIVRLFFDAPTGRKIGPLCRALAAARKVYRCVEPAELEKVAATVHHGGIVAIVTAPAWRPPTAAEIRRWAGGRAPLLLLDRIGNAHNLGAIARTAGYFGISRIILSDEPGAARPGEATYRIAEGGMEAVEIFQVPDLVKMIGELKAAGYAVVGAATRGGRPDLTRTGPPVALVLGNEEHGLTPAVEKACSALVTIPGSGRVESLNVSVAAAVLMWELWGRALSNRPSRTT